MFVVHPTFFGSVFADPASPAAVAFMIRIYGVLILTQAVLLHGIRQVIDIDCLRRFAATYAIIFTGTALVTLYADFGLGAVRAGGRPVLMGWPCLAAVYAGFALWPERRYFLPWTLVHMTFVGCGGLYAILFASHCARNYFVAESRDAYESVSRFYGVLILGMALHTQTARLEAARPAWPSLRLGFSAMFAASAACLAYQVFVEGPVGAVGVASLLGYLGLSVAYAAALQDHEEEKEEEEAEETEDDTELGEKGRRR